MKFVNERQEIQGFSKLHVWASRKPIVLPADAMPFYKFLECVRTQHIEVVARSGGTGHLCIAAGVVAATHDGIEALHIAKLKQIICRFIDRQGLPILIIADSICNFGDVIPLSRYKTRLEVLDSWIRYYKARGI